MVHVPETIITIKLVAHFEASTVLAFGSCNYRGRINQSRHHFGEWMVLRGTAMVNQAHFFEKQPLDQSIELRMAAVQVKTKLCGNFAAWTLRMGGERLFFHRREPYQIDQRATTAWYLVCGFKLVPSGKSPSFIGNSITNGPFSIANC